MMTDPLQSTTGYFSDILIKDSEEKLKCLSSKWWYSSLALTRDSRDSTLSNSAFVSGGMRMSLAGKVDYRRAFIYSWIFIDFSLSLSLSRWVQRKSNGSGSGDNETWRINIECLLRSWERDEYVTIPFRPSMYAIRIKAVFSSDTSWFSSMSGWWSMG